MIWGFLAPTFRLHDFLYFKRLTRPGNFLCVTPDERIRQLCAQLFRAESPEVLEAVASELQLSIQNYVRTRTSPKPAIGMIPLTAES